ncbi:type II toxin-antitoxin system VapC family toxin [Candidatus Daviesbacteria bacterium]|nr:type II toxin-antitoxin system VapC family toxin [Candidatus Daviesbacteria bacterium]
MYLLDTNVLILGIKAQNPDKSFLEKVISRKQLSLSVITVSEFLAQALQAEEKKINKLILRFPILPVDLEIAELAAHYRKKFLKTRRVQLLDYFLAAQAKINHLTLVTNNKADFPMKDIKIISPS